MERVRFESPLLQITTYLPEEVVIEILLRLPVKSLLKFRCVSKNWLSLISNSKFVKSHAQLSSSHTNRRLIISHTATSGDFPTFSSYILYPKFITEPIQTDIMPFDFPFKEMKCLKTEIVDSCNGLVCLVINGAIVMLWNPATRESTVLPCCVTYRKDKVRNGLSYGFGYDALNDDFKVVGYSVNHEKPIKIYSLRSNLWRSVDWIPLGGLVLRCSYGGEGVLSNGAVHWQAYVREGSVEKPVIIALNLNTETIDYIPFPADLGPSYETMVLGASEQNLLLASDCHVDSQYNVDIWMLKLCGAGESWIKIMHLPVFQHNLACPMVLFVSKDGEVILKNHSDRKVHKCDSPSGFMQFGGKIYKESLISPNSKDEAGGSRYHVQGSQ